MYPGPFSQRGELVCVLINTYPHFVKGIAAFLRSILCAGQINLVASSPGLFSINRASILSALGAPESAEISLCRKDSRPNQNRRSGQARCRCHACPTHAGSENQKAYRHRFSPCRFHRLLHHPCSFAGSRFRIPAIGHVRVNSRCCLLIGGFFVFPGCERQELRETRHNHNV